MDKEDIKKVGIRELRADIPKYLYGDIPFQVVRHGHTVGYYFPVQHESKAAEIEALQGVAKQCQDLLTQRGISEDDIVREFQKAKKAGHNKK